MQKKTWAVYIILTFSALLMNQFRFEYRFIIFPLMLLLLPFFVSKDFNLAKILKPSVSGLKEFILISVVVIIFFPGLFFLYNCWYLGFQFITPDKAAIISALNKGLSVLIIAALPEEIFFRGFLQETALKNLNKKLFLIVSQKNFIAAILFGLSHSIAFLNIAGAATFFPALLFGWLAEKSEGKVFYSFVFHGTANLLLFILLCFIK